MSYDIQTAFVEQNMLQKIATIADADVVAVIVGPLVARFVYEVEELVSLVPIKSAFTVRAAILLAAVETKICPAAVASAGAV